MPSSTQSAVIITKHLFHFVHVIIIIIIFFSFSSGAFEVNVWRSEGRKLWTVIGVSGAPIESVQGSVAEEYPFHTGNATNHCKFNVTFIVDWISPCPLTLSFRVATNENFRKKF